MEQSDSKRFQAHLPMLFSVDGHQGQARGLVYNLSADGCKATSDTRVAPGTYLNLRLYLPGSPAPVDVRLAAVRWSQERDFGVTFLHMQNEELQRLTRYLAVLETATAAS
jgi:PilZ domain-containing protein